MVSEDTLVKLVETQTENNTKILNKLSNIDKSLLNIDKNLLNTDKSLSNIEKGLKEVIDKYTEFHKTMIRIEVLMGVIAAAVIGILIAFLFK